MQVSNSLYASPNTCADSLCALPLLRPSGLGGVHNWQLIASHKLWGHLPGCKESALIVVVVQTKVAANDSTGCGAGPALQGQLPPLGLGDVH